VSDVQIPALFALAMGVDALTALIIGKAYDRVGLKTLMIIPLFSVFIPFLTFSNMLVFVIIGIILWGIVLGVHETIMRAAVADLTAISRRGVGLWNFQHHLRTLMDVGRCLHGNALRTFGFFFDFTGSPVRGDRDPLFPNFDKRTQDPLKPLPAKALS